MVTNADDAHLEHGGGLVEIDGETWYEIDGVHEMPPFLMSVVSDGDRWMFVSSSGALAAGRRDATHSLFPYVTDDRLHASGGMTGPVTAIRAGSMLWEPFAPRPTDGVQRTIAKTVLSDAVRFRERHEDLGLTVIGEWRTSDAHGFVRTTTVVNHGHETVTFTTVDGLLDLLPAGLDPIVYQRLSNLTNAYKRSEVVDPATGLALFTLEAPVSDQAEPEEVLRATAVWSIGPQADIDLSTGALDDLRRDRRGDPVHLLTGRAGAYLRRSTIRLEPGDAVSWRIGADVSLDHGAVSRLARSLGSSDGLDDAIERATRATGERLGEIMALADAQQRTADDIACAHHASNVVYNVMRGGVPLDCYLIDTEDLAAFVRQRSRRVAERHDSWLDDLPAEIDRGELLARVADRADVHLTRLADEYLPFSFSRRHGDPSRPWNQFSIRITAPDGSPLRYFEGNWRDVFQNWEALCASFPDYLPGVISTFVDASTADGYNPYRITRDGIDWEVPDPDDPWSNIGYWGDHQIVYLLRLLEAAEAHAPGALPERLAVRSCTSAAVPYRMSSYAELVVDPKDTVEFDEARDAAAARRVTEIGADGKLMVGADGEPIAVTLVEKLLVTTLAKLANLVPGGGIWMNTQRPEWNDANNALVGYGLSMVTLFHLRRFVEHVRSMLASLDPGAEVALSAEVAAWMEATIAALSSADPDMSAGDPLARRAMLDRLGTTASDHRTSLDRSGFSGITAPVARERIEEVCALAMRHLDATVARSHRSDGLAHSYNLLRLTPDGRAEIEHLPEMLEGQVAALTPGVVDPPSQADLLDALFASDLHRADIGTFTLMPARPPVAFLDKNTIDPSTAAGDPLLAALRAAGDSTIVAVDAAGVHRFAVDLTTAEALGDRLDELAGDERWTDLVATSRESILEIYESVFGHRSHLGRSGSMYAYEGIGSVYWHMVTKLLLAVQEAAVHALDDASDPAVVERLRTHYWRVRDGLGVAQSPQSFGAFPIDPYSHTPAHTGAQQPGMTGAVKEEILARRRELGVRVVDGRIAFDGFLLRDDERLPAATTWEVGNRTIDLPAGSVASMVCQVPVVVSTTDEQDPHVVVEYVDGRTERLPGDRLPVDTSASVFSRTGEVATIRATVPTS